ncbi:MAG: DUF3592 domain-containing protein [Anaerolineales bacterium]|nr:DUF3592 domain-containing protein [Anaerolineales bacterium]
MLLLAIGHLQSTWRMYTLGKEGETTIGRVVQVDKTTDSEGDCCVYYSTIEYMVNGRALQLRSRTPAYEVGREVEIIYLPGNPGSHAINRPSGLWQGHAWQFLFYFGAGLFMAVTKILQWRRGQPLFNE